MRTFALHAGLLVALLRHYSLDEAQLKEPEAPEIVKEVVPVKRGQNLLAPYPSPSARRV
jgi:hypothetical protein